MSATLKGPEDREIQAVLRDAGLEGDADLAAALGGMRALALDAPPAPRPDLAALLAPGVSSLDVRRRNRQRRMGAVIGAVVVGTMGLGAGAVAASSEDFRRSVGHNVERIFTPVPPAPAPAPASGTASPSPANVPARTAVPAAPSGGTAPAAPAPGSPEAVPASPSKDADPVRRPPAAGEKPDKAPVPAVRPSQLPTLPGAGEAPELPVKPSPPRPAVPALPGAVSDHGHDKP
ncbi:hypothetical protein [Arthrobacter sp. D1-17]